MHITQSTPHISAAPSFPTSTNPTVSENHIEHQHDEQTYSRIFSEITDKYTVFNQENEIGYQDKQGITGDIDSITKDDLISILKHIKSNPLLLEQCRKSSANSPLFTKLYLMSNNDQGWNLRLHTFSVKGSGLGGEDSPHFHRWTLASQVLSGGYINVNYQEGSIDQPHAKEHEYSKYELSASKNQSNKESRHTTFISKAIMTPTHKELYAQGATNHFPLKLAHSVETHASVMGTTMTLAHTAKSETDKSYAFEKNDEILEIPQRKIESNEEFETIIQGQITFLQVLNLSSKLNARLADARSRGLQLTGREEKHLDEHHEPNYIETSLLPAIAIYQQEAFYGVSHEEFSEEIQRFLDEQLSAIDPISLSDMINNNQGDIFDGRLSIEIKDVELSRQLKKRLATASA